jgi:uncharacterized protein
MQIDWAQFSPGSALIGGATIGLAAGLLIVVLGRIAGVSGIIAGLIPPRSGDADWRIAFLLGLFFAPILLALWRAPEPPVFSSSYEVLALAGVLVGFGSRLGSGCTSGHGVCGLSRLSMRSLVGTITFMLSAFATVFLLRHAIS